MIFSVERLGETIGTVEIEQAPHGNTFSVDCAAVTGDLLRCYGETEGAPLLLGVLEPMADGRLRCKKTFSPLSFSQQCKSIPTRYFAAKDAAEWPRSYVAPRFFSGDAVLDALLEDGELEAEETARGLRLRCVFARDRPFALCCAATACEIKQEDQNFMAILYLNPFYRT